MIKVQCPRCKNKVSPIDLRAKLVGFDNTKMCFQCRADICELEKNRKCKKSGCNKTIWVEPSGKHKSILHQYCEEHQKERIAELDEITKQWEKRIS